jgi:hypothetical protein
MRGEQLMSLQTKSNCEIAGHRSNGGTGLTNFDIERRPLYEAAIAECGDPNFFISDEPMPGTPANSRTANSLHYKGSKNPNHFWDIFYKLKKAA